MANIVLTNKNRVLGLPVKAKELLPDEFLVATNSPLGMLYIKTIDNQEILFDYEELAENEIPDGPPICLKSLSDYKLMKQLEIANELEQLNDLPKETL